MDYKKIGSYLLQNRKEKGMTQSELAKLLNVSHQAVSRWERGENLPDVERLSELAKLYQVSVDEILSIEQPFTEEKELTSIELAKQKTQYVIFWVSNILSILLAYIFTMYNNEVFEVMAYLSIVVFMFGANVMYHVKFVLIQNKDVGNILFYLRGYQTYLILVCVLSSLVMTGFLNLIFYITLVVFVLFTVYIEKKYSNIIEQRFIDFKRYTFYKIILVLVLSILFFSLFNPMILSFYYTGTILIIVMGLIAMLENKKAKG